MNYLEFNRPCNKRLNELVMTHGAVVYQGLEQIVGNKVKEQTAVGPAEGTATNAECLRWE